LTIPPQRGHLLVAVVVVRGIVVVESVIVVLVVFVVRILHGFSFRVENSRDFYYYGSE